MPVCVADSLSVVSVCLCVICVNSVHRSLCWSAYLPVCLTFHISAAAVRLSLSCQVSGIPLLEKMADKKFCDDPQYKVAKEEGEEEEEECTECLSPTTPHPACLPACCVCYAALCCALLCRHSCDTGVQRKCAGADSSGGSGWRCCLLIAASAAGATARTGYSAGASAGAGAGAGVCCSSLRSVYI